MVGAERPRNTASVDVVVTLMPATTRQVPSDVAPDRVAAAAHPRRLSKSDSGHCDAASSRIADRIAQNVTERVVNHVRARR